MEKVKVSYPLMLLRILNMQTVRADIQELVSERAADGMCDCCGGSAKTLVTQKRGYRLWKCDTCGLIFVYPQPTFDQLKQLYNKQAGYFATASAELEKSSDDYAVQLNRLLPQNGIERGNFLDVGCATGALLYQMRKLGWRVAGTEINPDAAAIAKKHNIDVFVGELNECPFAEGTFDAVHLGDVIEHVGSPRQTLLSVHRLLKPGGIITIQTTNTKCGFARSSMLLSMWFGFPWPYSEAPYHLYEFSAESLTRLVSSCGFEVISLERTGKSGFAYAVGATGFFDHLKARMKRTGRYRVNMMFLGSLPKLVVVAGLLLPFYALGRVLDIITANGSELFLVGQKSSAFDKNGY